MIVGQSKNSKLHWHALIDGRLLCQPELSTRKGSATEWRPELFMCQRCTKELDRADPRWEVKAKPKTLDDVINSLVKASRSHRNITNS